MEKEINGHEYRFGKLNAIQQFHVLRRLAPALAAVGVSLGTLKKAAGAADLIGPASEVLAKMSDEDSEFVLFTCLRSVHRKDSGGWAKIAAERATTLAYEDIDMPTMLNIVMNVLQHNLEGFFKGLGDETRLPSS